MIRIAVLTGAGTLVATAAAAWLMARERRGRPDGRVLLAAIVSIGLMCRILVAIVTPTFMAPDEEPHFAYVQFVAANHRLPIQQALTDAPTRDWEYYQAPLYYVALVPLHEAARRLHLGQAWTVRLLRLCSVPLWVFTVLFCVRWLRQMEADPFVITFVVSTLSLLPALVALNGVINNDNLINLLGAALFMCLARVNRSTAGAVGVGILLGLALLTKITGLVLIALVGLWWLVGVLRRGIDRAAFWRTALALATAGLMFLPLAWRNLRLYGSLSGLNAAVAPRSWPALTAFWQTLKIIHLSFFATAGVTGDVGPFFPSIVFPLSGVVVAYLAVVWTLRQWWAGEASPLATLRASPDILVASAVAIVIAFAAAFRIGFLYGFGQGRFLYVLLPPLAVFAAGMMRRPFGLRLAPAHVAGLFIVYGVSFTSFSLAVLTRAH